ncbi:hypothetical protein BCU91_01750 [Shewanella sp. 10N.286.52.B9]|nr:hypothetical protein BCU91_01750 [Shewanella sp. 10N.286.52.B9]
MENITEKRSLSQWFFGEYSWTLKFSWVLATLVCVYLGATREENIWILLVDGHVNSALLLYILGYLSDFRYRFIKESRNN